MEIREKKIKLCLEYIKERIREDVHPSHAELRKKFNIGVYHIKLTDLYPELGINVLNLGCKRPNNSLDDVQKGLLVYLKSEVEQGHYPTKRYIQSKFKLRIDDSIKDLYAQAGIQYKKAISQNIKSKKAELLQEIVLNVLPKLNLTLIKSRSTHERGIDILTEDEAGRLVGIEIKAHHQFEPIKIRNLRQVQRFIEKEKLYRAILATTSSNIKVENIPSNITILSYEQFRKICDYSQQEILDYIRNLSVHQESREKEEKKQEIVAYAADKINQGQDINCREIAKIFKVSFYTYFKNIYEIYDGLGVLPPISKMQSGKRSHHQKIDYREKIIPKMIDYIQNEVSNGYYPNGSDVGRIFGSGHIWNFVTMTELYQRAGLKPSRFGGKQRNRHKRK